MALPLSGCNLFLRVGFFYGNNIFSVLIWVIIVQEGDSQVLSDNTAART